MSWSWRHQNWPCGMAFLGGVQVLKLVLVLCERLLLPQ